MKKVLFSILSLGFIWTASAQVITDTVTTGTGYLNQKFYSLSAGEKTSMNAKGWHLAFRPNVGQAGASIRFNSLVGELRFLPNADVETSFVTVDTTGWAAQPSLYDLDLNLLIGAFNQNSEIATSGDQFDYSWGQYVMASHSVTARRAFGAKIGTDFYVFKFNLDAVAKIYTVTYFKLGNSAEETYTVDMSAYTDRNYVYSNIIDKSTLNNEPKTSEWDLFFGQYSTDVGGGTHYPVAGVLNNLGTQVAKVITNDAVNYTQNGSELFETTNNVINYTWKTAGQGGVTIADTVVYFMKAVDGAVWKLRFTGFISASAPNLPGSYILEKQVVSAVGLDKKEQTFMEMYPNPSNENLQIVLDAATNTSVTIYNLTGEQVYTTTTNNNGLQTLQVNTADFANGMYQVVVTSSGIQTAKKLLIQH